MAWKYGCLVCLFVLIYDAISSHTETMVIMMMMIMAMVITITIIRMLLPALPIDWTYLHENYSYFSFSFHYTTAIFMPYMYVEHVYYEDKNICVHTVIYDGFIATWLHIYNNVLSSLLLLWYHNKQTYNHIFI